MTDPREPLGRLVRQVWVNWAREQPDAKASWLAPWEHLTPDEQEVDMRIGEAIAVEARGIQRELLTEAADALWGCAKAALTVKPSLEEPYRNAPNWTPWSTWMERPARQAHDVTMKIRKHLREVS